MMLNATSLAKSFLISGVLLIVVQNIGMTNPFTLLSKNLKLSNSKMTQTPFKKSDISLVEISPTWKWERDEFRVGISTSLIGEGDHVLHENTVFID
tara:strand:+ start:298 stop:585 length:288 start_codon:yes stop_codon:yes gene_type:complete